MKNPKDIVLQLSPRLVTLFVALALAGVTESASAWNDKIQFDLVRSSAVVAAGDNVLINAQGRVRIESVGPVEIMDVKVWGLPAKTDFDFFVIQVPNGPFGLSWYQGDIETNGNGVGHRRFIGRFSIETFIVAPGPAPAPTPHSSPHSRMRPRIRQPHRFTPFTWDCGLMTLTMRRRQAFQIL